jgi:hypothetical protein
VSRNSLLTDYLNVSLWQYVELQWYLVWKSKYYFVSILLLPFRTVKPNTLALFKEGKCFDSEAYCALYNLPFKCYFNIQTWKLKHSFCCCCSCFRLFLITKERSADFPKLLIKNEIYIQIRKVNNLRVLRCEVDISNFFILHEQSKSEPVIFTIFSFIKWL